MKYHSIFSSGLLASVAILLGCWGVAVAQEPLEPVQHVYPESTLAEIQQAIDNGGTVYFERLTKTTGQYSEYNQVASSTPDLPPTAANPAKSFNIGVKGKDVNIIGVLGPNGERPKINGGTPVFSAVSVRVSFKIENLELSNPDMQTAPGLYSRIGVWVLYTVGARTTINNCKITIAGKDTDTAHATNHSVAIWFYLMNNQSQPPASGALIDVTNNTIIATKAHEGIHVGSFWPETLSFTAPRVFINNNTVNVTTANGYANQLGTDGATLASAILLNGNVSHSIVTNNIIEGDGRSPYLTPTVESVGIALLQNSASDMLTNVTVVGNDSSSFSGDVQLRIDPVVSWSTVARNSFGAATRVGVVCHGHDNWFDKNDFYGDYPGWAAGGPGLVRFMNTSAGNRLTNTTLNDGDACGQVDDQSGSANTIPGYDECLNSNSRVRSRLKQN